MNALKLMMYPDEDGTYEMYTDRGDIASRILLASRMRKIAGRGFMDGAPSREFWSIWKSSKPQLQALGVSPKKGLQGGANADMVWRINRWIREV